MHYDYLVAIGRFEPFHNGHKALIDHALSLADKVIVIIGSANKPSTIKNPWSDAERATMIRASFAPEQAARLELCYLEDDLYNDQTWVADVQRLAYAAMGETMGSAKVGLIGHHRDASSYYLEMFPQWDLVELPDIGNISATDIRKLLFENHEHKGKWMAIEGLVPAEVASFLKVFASTAQFAQLTREYEFVRAYKKAWESAPYAPTFVTTDAVVVHSGHILLVERRAEPGKGLWALPGGFIGQDERVFDACIRELREETRLKVPAPVLRGSLKGEKVFDHPDRSTRGRTITHAYFFEFPSGALPPVKGGDDAAKARWFPLALALQMDRVMFEDHLSIIRYFVGRA